jgi:CHAT domain-containing protein
VRRIDDYIEHFRKTFDQQSRRADLAQAETELVRSAASFLEAGNAGSAAFSLLKAGDACRILNQAQKATAHYEEALRLARQSRTTTNEVLALLGRARLEAYVVKNAANGRRYFEQAVQLSAKLADKTHHFNALGGWGSMLAEHGDLTGAADAYAQAFALASQIKDEKLLFYAYLDRADAYGKMAEKCDYENNFEPCYEQLNLAKNDYLEALRLAKKLGYAGLASQTQAFIDRLELRRQMFRMRERGAQAVRRTGLFHPKVAQDVFVSENYTSGSVTFPPGFMQLVHEGILASGDPRSVYVRGLLHALQNEKKEALAAHLNAVELLEADRRKLRDETGSRAVLDDRISFYYEPINYFLEQRRYEQAFNLMERCRSRAMTDLIMGGKLALQQSGGGSLFARLQETRSQIGSLQDKLFRTRAGPAREQDQVAIHEWESEIARLQQVYREISAELNQRAPALAELAAPVVIPLPRLQQVLGELKADMLYYLIRDHGLLLWHINEKEVHVRNVFIPASELESKIQKLLTTLSAVDPGKIDFDHQTARELFLFAVQPALGWIKSKRLILVPHESLHYLPFQVLQDPVDQAFLGERFALSYVPNATLLTHFTESGPLQRGQLLAVADKSLEEDSKEIEGLQLDRLFPQRHKVLLDPSKEQLKNSLGAYDYVHMSVHGAFNPNEPMLSYLRIGSDPDSTLTAAEVFGLQLPKARLVVLSACESGNLVATRGNELIGMQRAFLFAGAKSLLVSNWKVDAEATAEWMGTFYREAQTKAPPEAARLSLLAVKKRYAHPFYWGAFQLTGQ